MWLHAEKVGWGKHRCAHLVYATLTLSLFAILWNMFLGHFLRQQKFYEYFTIPLFKNDNATESDYLFKNDSINPSDYMLKNDSPTESATLVTSTCSPWHTLSTDPTLSGFIRNGNLFLTLEGDWWHQANYLTKTLPYGIKGSEQIIRQILIKTKSHMPAEIDSLQCKRCVVVGNGNSLRNSLLGAVINKYNVVIRLNNAPVRGYEEDVGNKTTLRIFYPESAIKDLAIENNPDTLFVLIPFKAVDVNWLKAILYNESNIVDGFWRKPASINTLDPSKVRMLSPLYLQQAVETLLHQPHSFYKAKSLWPTTGFLAITMALNYCDEVDVAGFGYPLNQKNGLIHYYDQLKMAMVDTSVHNVTQEHVYLKKLQSTGIIRYLT
ncbi:CMP-N-acetylneuraminate-beta-galactosamide-alpha-2,3-sialyltransferase 4-like isoform X2 [Leucoraja erinacea]|uniref:CMP-N-acetylneuraminate-beta-galactosamide- alpha-2,3-sialyltransferase 4-like isoform X2 n=1 Tax=Leucoraja erinaceus TaxID=7782 RepID=UPI00245723C8|nr:CMP-N-acetylneuraminate-beta-galactosamide-alpha-2,3-sialyltransferase 4-like isoform X2 [Leucoraja erinacea]